MKRSLALTTALLLIAACLITVFAGCNPVYPISSSSSPSSSVETERSIWFGYVKGKGDNARMTDLTGIEGDFYDNRGNAPTKDHGYYSRFNLHDFSVASDGLSAAGKLHMEWEPQTRDKYTVPNGRVIIDANVSVTFDPSDTGALKCTISTGDNRLNASGFITESDFTWGEDSVMDPGYTKIDDTVTLDQPLYRNKHQ